MTLYENREDAGRQLARCVHHLKQRPNLLVLGLPRGGVPVARVIADELGAELDVLLVRKLGVPGFEELAMGAVSLDGARVLNFDIVERLSIPPETIDAAADAAAEVLRERSLRYRGTTDPPVVDGKTVVVVDDGLATGATIRAAAETLRHGGARVIVIAAPVAPSDAADALADVADEVILDQTPSPFRSVGSAYRDFEQVSDAEVKQLLKRTVNPSTFTEADRHP